MEMIRIIQDLRIEFNKEIETLKKTHAEMKNKLKNPITQPENSKESLKVERIKQKIEC